MGIHVPSFDRIALAGAGALGPELVEMLVEEFAPEFVQSEGGQLAVSIGSYLAPPLLAQMFLGRRAAGDVLFGEAINLTIVGGRKLIESISTSTPATQAAGYIGAGASVPRNGVAGYITPGGRRGMRGYHTTSDRLAQRYPNRNYR